jgi:hypothetical protein
MEQSESAPPTTRRAFLAQSGGLAVPALAEVPLRAEPARDACPS